MVASWETVVRAMNEGQVKITKDNTVIAVPNTMCYHVIMLSCYHVAHAFIIQVSAICWTLNTHNSTTCGNLKVRLQLCWGFQKDIHGLGLNRVYRRRPHLLQYDYFYQNKIDNRYHWIRLNISLMYRNSIDMFQQIILSHIQRC